MFLINKHLLFFINEVQLYDRGGFRVMVVGARPRMSSLSLQGPRLGYIINVCMYTHIRETQREKESEAGNATYNSQRGATGGN